MTLNEAVKMRIDELCRNEKITVYSLAKKGGIQKTTLYQIKDGKDVMLSTILDVSATLDISLSEFFDSPIFDDVMD